MKSLKFMMGIGLAGYLLLLALLPRTYSGQQQAWQQKAPLVLGNNKPLNFTKLTVYNKYRGAAEARKSCGVDPVKIKAAIKAFQELLDGFPDSTYTAEAYYEIGQLYKLLKDIPKAIESFWRVAQAYPGSRFQPLALLELGEHLAEFKEYGQAIQALEALVRLYPTNPRSPQALLKISEYYDKLKQPEAALSTLEYLVKTYPNSQIAAKALYELG